jgi:hypothetical protein
MLNLWRSSIALLFVWLAILGLFLIVRPRPFTLVFWGFVVAVVLAGLAKIYRDRLDATVEKNAYRQWATRLVSLHAILDIEDDGHIYEWLDLQQWQDVFSALETMPKDSRSLRAAILATYPEVLTPTPPVTRDETR